MFISLHFLKLGLFFKTKLSPPLVVNCFLCPHIFGIIIGRQILFFIINSFYTNFLLVLNSTVKNFLLQ